MSRPLVIDIVDGKGGVPRVLIKSGNGKTLLGSEPYNDGERKALHAVDVLTQKLADGDYVIKRNGEVI